MSIFNVIVPGIDAARPGPPAEWKTDHFPIASSSLLKSVNKGKIYLSTGFFKNSLQTISKNKKLISTIIWTEKVVYILLSYFGWKQKCTKCQQQKQKPKNSYQTLSRFDVKTSNFRQQFLGGSDCNAQFANSMARSKISAPSFQNTNSNCKFFILKQFVKMIWKTFSE